MRVPLADLRAQYTELKAEIDSGIAAVLESGNYIDGENVTRLEQQVAEICGASHGIGVASGTDALVLSLVACGVKPGDEVITTPFTFGATTEAIALVGARAVYVDIDLCTYNLDITSIESAVTPKTTAILPVDLFGQMADRSVLHEVAQQHNLKVIADAAQAIGAKQGNRPVASDTDATTLSFYPTKNLGACGDAGMVLMHDADLAARVRSLHAHGQSSYGYFERVGYCSRLDTLQAVILMAKLPHLEKWNAARRAHAALYNELLAGCPVGLPGEEANNYHIYHQYTVRYADRDGLQSFLRSQGIDSKVFYPHAMHLQPAYSNLGYHEGDFPAAERAAKEVLSIPIVPELTDEQIAFTAAQIRTYVEAKH